MAEIAESALLRGDEDFLYFFYFRGTKKYYPHEIIIVPQKEQKWQKGLRWLIRKIPLFNSLKFLTLKF